jgi:hypothetical protein
VHEFAQYCENNPRHNVQSHILFSFNFDTRDGSSAALLCSRSQKLYKADRWHRCAGGYATKFAERWENDQEECYWAIANIQVNLMCDVVVVYYVLFWVLFCSILCLPELLFKVFFYWHVFKHYRKKILNDFSFPFTHRITNDKDKALNTISWVAWMMWF